MREKGMTSEAQTLRDKAYVESSNLLTREPEPWGIHRYPKAFLGTGGSEGIKFH